MSHPKPVLLLHVGPHKTGSTAIQTFCEQNRKGLARAGFWYPKAGIAGGQHLLLPASYLQHHHCLAKDLLNGNPEQILASIEAETPPGLIPLLSSEVFWELLTDLPDAFESVLALLDQRYRVHFVMVERQEDERVWSLIKHFTRQGWAIDPAVFFTAIVEADLLLCARLSKLGYPLIRVPYDAIDCISRFLMMLSSQLNPWQVARRLWLAALLRRCRKYSSRYRVNVAPKESWASAFILEFSRRLEAKNNLSYQDDPDIQAFFQEMLALGDRLPSVHFLPDDKTMFQRIKHANGSPACLLKPKELRAWESICKHPDTQFAAQKAGCSDKLSAVTLATNHLQPLLAN
jgi:hypothetical protein